MSNQHVSISCRHFPFARSTNGTLVSSFGNNGTATVGITGGYFAANTAVFETDGSILIAGYGQSNDADDPDFAMARLDSAGAHDTTFGGGYNDGIVLTSFGDNDGDVANTAALGPGDEILLAGGTEQWAGSDALWAVAQYNSDGTLDTGFGSSGKKTISMDTIHYGDMITSAAIGYSGTNEVIYLTGPTNHDDIRVVALNANGSVDTAFGSSGTAKANLSDYGYATAVDVAVDSNGKILVTANANLNGDAGVMVARFNTSGFLDTSFGSGGDFVDTDVDSPYVTSMALTSGGNIVVAGQAEGGEFMVNEYSPTETQDFASVSSPFTVVQRYAYTPYGLVTVLNADWSPATVSFGHDANGWVYGFQGMEFDTVSGLYAAQGRWENPNTGTWTQQDPAAVGTNLYQFCGGNPNSQVDPSGCQGESGINRVEPLPDQKIITVNAEVGSIGGMGYSDTVTGTPELAKGPVITQGVNDKNQCTVSAYWQRAVRGVWTQVGGAVRTDTYYDLDPHDEHRWLRTTNTYQLFTREDARSDVNATVVFDVKASETTIGQVANILREIPIPLEVPGVDLAKNLLLEKLQDELGTKISVGVQAGVQEGPWRASTETTKWELVSTEQKWLTEQWPPSSNPDPNKEPPPGLSQGGIGGDPHWRQIGGWNIPVVGGGSPTTQP